MADIKFVYNKTLVRDDQLSKTHTMKDSDGEDLIVDSVVYIDVVEREQKPINIGSLSTYNRLYEISMVYFPDLGVGTEVKANIVKVTTKNDFTATLVGSFNKALVTNINMNALPTNISDDTVIHNCFFWSTGVADGSLCDIHAQRIDLKQGEEESGITILDAVTDIEYSTTIKVHTIGLSDIHDVFTVVPEPN